MVVVDMKRAIILQKPSGTIAIAGNLNAVERKFYDGFLYVARETLKQDAKEDWFSAPLIEIKKMFGLEEDKNNRKFREIVRKLSNTEVEYNILGKDEIIDGYAHCLDNIEYITDKTTHRTIVKFSIPKRVRQSMIEKNGIYASIDLIIVKGLKSRYSVILYEICKDYEKVQIPIMKMREFREIFGIQDKYKAIHHLKSRVLNSAVNELNNNPNIDFLVDYKLLKSGNAYTHIKFIVSPKPAQVKAEQTKKKLTKQVIEQTPELSELLTIVPEEYRQRKNLISLLLGGIEKKGKDYVKAQIEYINSQKNVKNYISYLKKAIESDYASVEVVNLDGAIKTEDDWKNELIEKNKTYIFDGGEYKIKLIEDCDEDGYCNVQFRDVKDNERVKWVKVLESKLKEMAEK